MPFPAGAAAGRGHLSAAALYMCDSELGVSQSLHCAIVSMNSGSAGCSCLTFRFLLLQISVKPLMGLAAIGTGSAAEEAGEP